MKTKDWRGGLQTTITNTTYLAITRLRRGVPPRLRLLVILIHLFIQVASGITTEKKCFEIRNKPFFLSLS
jgi:hypothetical protein